MYLKKLFVGYMMRLSLKHSINISSECEETTVLTLCQICLMSFVAEISTEVLEAKLCVLARMYKSGRPVTESHNLMK